RGERTGGAAANAEAARPAVAARGIARGSGARPGDARRDRGRRRNVRGHRGPWAGERGVAAGGSPAVATATRAVGDGAVVAERVVRALAAAAHDASPLPPRWPGARYLRRRGLARHHRVRRG